MNDHDALIPLHPQGEGGDLLLSTTLASALSAADAVAAPLRVQTPGGAVFVEWDPQAALTPIGQLVFFAQFLEVGGLFDALCASCPVRLSSPNARREPATCSARCWIGILCGQWRYAHLSAVRFDPVNPALLGMEKVVSEDSARRFLRAMSPEQSGAWLRGQLGACYGALLAEPWVLDVDTTIKPIYGHQDAAKKGYNPDPAGTPEFGLSQLLHWHAAGVPGRGSRIGRPSRGQARPRGPVAHHRGAAIERRPECLRGDLAYGEEKLMSQCEERGQQYLFKLRQSPRVEELIKLLEKRGAWEDAGQGFEGIQSKLRLKAWTRERRVVVLRRPIRRARATCRFWKATGWCSRASPRTKPWCSLPTWT
ncbi:MAG: hypothetical protein ABI680_06610 [Chthoniobacteraceae bacterium]